MTPSFVRLSTRETVVLLTPARAATSAMVIGTDPSLQLPSSGTGSGSGFGSGSGTQLTGMTQVTSITRR